MGYVKFHAGSVWLWGVADWKILKNAVLGYYWIGSACA